MSIILY